MGPSIQPIHSKRGVVDMEDLAECLQDGLVARFDSIVSMRGEEIAIMAASDNSGKSPSHHSDSGHESDSNDGSGSSAEDSSFSEGTGGVSYMELQFAADAVASQLRYRFGAATGDAVILCCKGNAVAEIVAMLACLKTNVTFVPVDLSWIGVGTRLQDIVEDSKPVAAIVVAADDNDTTVAHLAAVGLFRCVYVTENGDLVEAFNTLRDDNGYAVETYSYDNSSAEQVDATDSSDIPLYILYTSGSTGRPKGVLGTHKGLINRILWQWRVFPFGPGEVACRRTPLIFVDSMAEIFSALLSITPLWCPPPERIIAEGIGGMAQEANRAGVSRVTLLPSQLQQALRLHPDLGAVWQSLRTVFVSGEECSKALASLVKERLPDVTLVNLYGSTEVAGDVSFAVLSAPEDADAPPVLEVATASTVPIGKPIEGNFLFIVSWDGVEGADGTVGEGQMRVLHDGQVGELLVVGEHLALGYHNHAISASAKFLPNPFWKAGGPVVLEDGVDSVISSYERAFLTGDLAYRMADGAFYLCGRKDRQVKLRGVRLELEEVERNVCQVLGVDDGVVALAVRRAGENSDGPVLVVVVEDRVLTSPTIRQEAATTVAVHTLLQERLLPAMVPALVLSRSSFPRSTAGKLDRTALQREVEASFLVRNQPESSARTSAKSVANDATCSFLEMTHDACCAAIVRVFAEVLGIEAPTDAVQSQRLFALGGDSVRMIEVLWRMRQWTGRQLVPADLQLTVGELVDKLRDSSQRTGEDSSEEHPAKRVRREDVPLVTAADSGDHYSYPMPLKGVELKIPENSIIVSVGRSQSDNTVYSDSAQLAVRWSVKLAKCVDASALVVTWKHPAPEAHSVCSMVVIGSHGGDVMAVDAVTGEAVWTLQLGEHIEAAACLHQDSEMLYIASFSGQDVDGFRSRRRTVSEDSSAHLGCLWAVHARTGSVLWHLPTVGEIKSSPVVVGAHVLVGCYDGHLYQVHCSDGQVVGRYNCGGSIYATPVINSDGTKAAVVTTSGKVTLLVRDADNECFTVQTTIQGQPTFSTPIVFAIDGEERVVLAGTDGTVKCLHLHGQLEAVWSEALSSTAFFSSPCIADRSAENGAPLTVVLGCHDGRLRKVKVVDGSVVWETSLGVALFASPFMLAEGRECAVATVAGDIVVVNAETGLVRTKLRLAAEVFSSPVCMGGCLYIGCRDDRLYCLNLA